MARVSISEAARLVKVSRPTIYKMINSGKLLHLCCKAREGY
jgi:excisionase family DNA binding protein